MATSPDDTLTYRRFKDGEHTWSSQHDNIFVEDSSYKCPTYIQKTPPCQGSCPSGHDVRGWLQIVRGIETPTGGLSMQEYAFRRATSANPFPAMMGRVCPAPCQEGCNRNDVDDFVGINSIEQYIGDSAREGGFAFEAPAKLSGKKVAIVGAGPAGMAAAYQLRKMGHASVVFDDHEEMGGMMFYGIPNYRTPREALRHENQRILDMGDIEFRGNTRVGRDVSVEELERDFDAILWALGAKKGRGLFLDNWDEVPNCVTAVDFLEQFNKGEMQYTSPKIVCVGGGDTSIDVVSVARRIGTRADYNEFPEDAAEGRIVHDVDIKDNIQCESVVLTAVELIAAEHEIHDAEREGVKILKGIMPLEIITDENGRATALKLVECTMEGGIPKAVEGGKETIIEADLIVSAIGQFTDLDGVEVVGNGKNSIDADQFYQVPNKPGHFAAGDVIRPHLLTTAIGHASIAAESINNYFNNTKLKRRPKVDKHHFDLLDKLSEFELAPTSFKETMKEDMRGTDTMNYAVHNFDDRSEHEIIESSELFLGHFERVDRNLRVEEVPDDIEVLGHFMERMKGLDDETAIKEADRCMSCGMCFECDNCVIFCPQDAVFKVKRDTSVLGRYVDTDYSRCIGCHVCADVCPTGYIEMGLGG
jgi:NADPH-dependent glutamate synthase beta subunit-like oxidoreductase